MQITTAVSLSQTLKNTFLGNGSNNCSVFPTEIWTPEGMCNALFLLFTCPLA